MVSEFLDWNRGYFRLVNPDVIFHGWPRRKSSRWIIHDLKFFEICEFHTFDSENRISHIFSKLPKNWNFLSEIDSRKSPGSMHAKANFSFFRRKLIFLTEKFEKQGCLLSFELEELLTDSSNRINIDWFCINQSHPRDTYSTFWQMTHRLWLTSFDS